MSRGLNKVQIIGRLGRDPEMRYTADGKAVTNFSVATGGKWQGRDGTERDDTEWFRVEAWDKLGETCNQYLTKGTEVYIEGRLKTRKYTDKDGIERTSVDVVANNMVMLGSRNGQNAERGDSYGSDEEYAAAPQRQAAAPQRQAPAQQRQAPPAPARQAPARPAARNVPQQMEDEEDLPF